MGKKPHFYATEDERKLVEEAVAVAISAEQIVMLIRRPTGKDGAMEPISHDTLVRHFADELATGRTRMLHRISGRLLRAAAGFDERASVLDEQRAAFFILKTVFGFRETDRLEIDVPDEEDGKDTIAREARLLGALDTIMRRRKKAHGGETLN